MTIDSTVKKREPFERKRGKNLVVIAIVVAVTLFCAFDVDDLRRLPHIVATVDKTYIALAFVAMLLFFLCQSIIVKRLLVAFGYPVRLTQTYQYTLIDYYFSAITPGASGGQPSEIYFMNKDNIPVGVSSLVMLIFNGLYHIAVLVTIGIAAFGHVRAIFDGECIFYGLFIVGIAIQAALVALFFFLIFSKKFAGRLADGACALMKKLRIKRAAEIEEKIRAVLSEYRAGAAWLSRHVDIVLKLLPLAIAHIVLFYSITFWISRAFGIGGGSIREIIAYQGVYTMTFESLPLPGGVGLAETGFLKLFRSVYPPHMMAAALLLTRGITYYSFLALGAVVTFFASGQKRAVARHAFARRRLLKRRVTVRPARRTGSAWMRAE
ncbi:MAG: lysylphosphatidylglycerol synthase transmembrane domain-containing protein [Peptoniphilus sp.]|nr:lysylphosphatidylglycerol synthase transmembrane domain-containing protein [Peptoniphilus sp.]MDD7362711.1 lysylphosphatidylglycerol synthase transmembrane domain-containing protein [Bacillota bacterium]MDY6044595.1 lysylphosphatidylglycerol synthase transmembrane domain-containing protein [Peptoniphilus sp.]